MLDICPMFDYLLLSSLICSCKFAYLHQIVLIYWEKVLDYPLTINDLLIYPCP